MTELRLSYEDLCVLSRAFNDIHDLRTEQERRINDELKRHIAASKPSHDRIPSRSVDSPLDRG